MFGFLKKRARRVTSDITKFDKRDMAQAVVNAAWLVAYADGSCDPTERAKIDQVLKTNPVLYNFTSELQDISTKIVNLLETDFKIGRRAALREIEDVKGDQREAEDVLDVAVAIAEADGSVEQAEMKVLEQIALVLGLRLENHLE